jgi:outer membrane protein TolC
MPIERLRADLARLREEIVAAEGGDREALVRLEELTGEVERELDEEARLKDPAGLLEELEQGVSRFEATHPNLSAILNNIVSLLGSMGV